MKNRDRGDESERKVEEALKILKGAGAIVDFYHARKCGELDSEHINFLVYFKNRLALPIQVKSGTRSPRTHYKNYPYIFAFLVRESHEPQKIASRFSSIFPRLMRRACAEAKIQQPPT